MAKQQESRYSRIEQDEDNCGVDCVHLGYYRANLTLLRWSFLINILIAVALFSLVANLSLQYQKSTSASHNDEIISSQLLEEQYGVSTKIATIYNFFQDGFDDEDFQKGDRYWAELFPSNTLSELHLSK